MHAVLTVDEYVVFVAPSVHQLNAYGRILNTDFMAAVIRGETDKQPLGYSASCSRKTGLVLKLQSI